MNLEPEDPVTINGKPFPCCFCFGYQTRDGTLCPSAYPSNTLFKHDLRPDTD